MGDNTIIARVTAEDTSITKDYTVTITREPLAGASGNANLSALIASTATSETGTYSAQTLAPAFDKATTAYTVRMVDPDITHAKLTPTEEDTGKATVQVGKRGSLNTVTSGSASGAIALNMGANEIIVRVTAENGVTKHYAVAISVGAPDVPTGLVVTPRPHVFELT